jgi:hypothetical protein
MKTHLDIVNFDTYVAACAGRAGVRVQWDTPESVPRTNGKIVYLPHITSKTTDEQLARLRFFIKHETEHVAYTDYKYMNNRKPIGLLMYVLNVLEDNRIDNINDEMYAGDRAISEEYYRLFNGDMEERAAKNPTFAKEMDTVAPLLAWSADHMPYVSNASLLSKTMLKAMSPISVKRYEGLSSGTYGADLEALRTSKKGATEDLFALAERILKEIYKEDPEKYKDKEDKDKEGKGKGKGEGEEESPGGDGEGYEDGEGEEAGKATGDIIEVEEMMKMSGNHFDSEVGIHWKHKVGGKGTAWTIPNKDEYVVCDFPISHPKMPPSRYSRFDSLIVNETIDNVAKPLSNKLRVKLQVRSQGRYEGNKKRGNIHSGGLHKIITAKGTDSESKVFRQHIVSDTLDTAVSLLVDCSGSMSGNKYAVACAAAGALSYALEPLHISHCIYGFTNSEIGNEEPVIFRFKKWGERVAQEKLLSRFSEASSHLNNNSDGDAIAYTAHDLLQQKAHRKILIVLSDGSPSGRWHAGDVTQYTHDVINSIEKGKKMEIHGIGIRDTNVQMYYKNNRVITKIEDLPNAVLSILDKSI